MKIRYSHNRQLVNEIKQKLKQNNGYCPCRIGTLPENKCMCQEFRQQISDPSWSGECHCGLYVKEL